MSLDGLRAWIAEVERKLHMRTRVFLVLVVIAVGGAGASIYLATNAQDDSISESEVRALLGELESRVGAGTTETATTEVAQLRAEVEALQTQVREGATPGGIPSEAPEAEEMPEGAGESKSRGPTGEAESPSEAPADKTGK